MCHHYVQLRDSRQHHLNVKGEVQMCLVLVMMEDSRVTTRFELLIVSLQERENKQSIT